ncbi:MAG: DUF4923 family protein [Paramuribaculum sp.]|nr:DUF4923 family protein [Paramuribaculum sp.]
MKKLLAFIVIALGCIGSASAQSFNLKDMLGGLISSDKITVKSMVGTWNYSAPAVTFKSSNLLKKAGGAAASSAVESKLSPYYQKAGLTKVVLTVAEDSTFTMSMGKTTLKGTITTLSGSDSQANFVFNFKVGGKLPIGKMNTYVTKVGSNNLSVTFDVSKLVSIVEKAGSITGSSTISGITKVLQGYDGVCAGFKLTKK